MLSLMNRSNLKSAWWNSLTHYWHTYCTSYTLVWTHFCLLFTPVLTTVTRNTLTTPVGDHEYRTQQPRTHTITGNTYGNVVLYLSYIKTEIT